MMLCDGCNVAYHMKCTGLTAVLEGDWLCEDYLEILEARRERYQKATGVAQQEQWLDMRAEPPMLPALPPVCLQSGNE